MARVAYLALGWFCVGLGFVGIFLPVLPTTPFLIVAVWAFGRGSQRWHDWLHTHPRFGPTLQRWEQYRVIPLSGKILSLSMMSASFAYIVIGTAAPIWAKATVGFCMLCVAGYILSKPSRAPQQAGKEGKGSTLPDSKVPSSD